VVKLRCVAVRYVQIAVNMGLLSNTELNLVAPKYFNDFLVVFSFSFLKFQIHSSLVGELISSCPKLAAV